MSEPTQHGSQPDTMIPARGSPTALPDVGTILNALPSAIVLVDLHAIITFANRPAEMLFKRRSGDLVGMNIGVLIPSFAGGALAEHWPMAKGNDDESRETVYRDVIGLRADGTQLRLAASCHRITSPPEGSTFMLSLQLIPEHGDQAADTPLLTRAFEQNPFAMLIVDRQGRAVHGNPAFCRLAGATIHALRGHCLDEENPDRESVSFAEKLHQLRTARADSRVEQMHRVIDGAAVSLLETLSPILDDAGAITHYLVTRQEITEQERTKSALQRSEQRFRKVTELAGEWLWEQNAEGRYTYSSAALFDILGYRPEDILGKSYLDILTVGDRQHWTTALPASPNIPRPFHRLINRYRHRDGHEVFTESSGEPVLGEQGEILAWRGVDHDITARKRFEDALRVRERAIDAASVGITIIDARAERRPIIYVNAALSQMIGLSQEQMLYRTYEFLQGPRRDGGTWGPIDEALNEGSGCSLTARLYRQDGESFWSDLQISPVRDAEGEVTHFVWVIADVTERQRAAEARHELEMARHIQTSLLPKASLRSDRLEATGICIPAGAIGGDFYDYFTTKDGVSLAIADVSGHNVGAALMMSETRSALRAEIRTARAEGRQFGPADMLALLNELLFEDLNGADLFITMFFIDFDPITRRLRYANAGHCPGLVAKRGQTDCLALDADGLILGVRPKVRFDEKSLLLKAGDVVLLYTDGVIESSDPKGDFYGIERLSAQLIRHRNLPVEALTQALLSDVRGFSGNGRLSDDTSLLALKAL